MKEKFILTDGYVEVDNTQFHIQVNGFKKDLKNRGGWLTVLLVIISTNVFNNFRNEKHFQKASNYFDFGLQILGIISIVCILWYIIFRKKWFKSNYINELKKIKVNKILNETEITIYFKNNRTKVLEFRNLENQLEPFIEALKKRNSRIEIIYL